MNQETAEPKDEVSRWAEDRLQTEPQEAAVTKAFPCPLCEASFDTQQQRQGHMSGKHRRKGTGLRVTRAQILARKRAYNTLYRARKKKEQESPEVPHYKTRAYRRRQYVRIQKRYKALGLDTHGKPRRKTHLSAKGLNNILIAQRARRQREKLNGASAPEQQPPPQLDIAGAAEQIVQAARTLVNLAQMNRIP